MRSTDSAGSLAIAATQSPTRMRPDGIRSELTRGALADAPRRDTTMTQNSDSGDAVGDAGPTTDSPHHPLARLKIRLIEMLRPLGKNCRATILQGPRSFRPVELFNPRWFDRRRARDGKEAKPCVWMTCRRAAISKIVA